MLMAWEILGHCSFYCTWKICWHYFSCIFCFLFFFYSYRSIFLITLLNIVALLMNFFFHEMPEILHNFIIPISFSLLQILVLCKYHNLRIKHINIYSHALSLNYVKVIKRTIFVLNSKSLHYCKLSFSKYPFQKYNYDFFYSKESDRIFMFSVNFDKIYNTGYTLFAQFPFILLKRYLISFILQNDVSFPNSFLFRFSK